MAEMITITKVVSRNFIMDLVASVQNVLGMNLTSYEAMVEKGTSLCEKELNDKNLTMTWYRYEITQLTNGALVIMLYGDAE